MKNRRILNEQTSTLKDFFYPGCFTAGDPNTDPEKAAIVTIRISGKSVPAIKKKSVKRNAFAYYTLDNKVYMLQDGVFKQVSTWNCKEAPGKTTANPEFEYFNNLNLDLTKPDNIYQIKDAAAEISRIIASGGIGRDLRNFKEAFELIKKDPTLSQKLKDVELITAPNGDVAAEFEKYSGHNWQLRNPFKDEIDLFEPKTISIGNGSLTYYTWQSAKAPEVGAPTYDATDCYNSLINYVQRAQQGVRGGANQFKGEKTKLKRCYAPFFRDGALQDEDMTGTVELGLRGKQRTNAEKSLNYLMQKRDEWGIGLSDGSQQTQTVQYESLDRRLKKALLEATEQKKKNSLRAR